MEQARLVAAMCSISVPEMTCFPFASTDVNLLDGVIVYVSVYVGVS